MDIQNRVESYLVDDLENRIHADKERDLVDGKLFMGIERKRRVTDELNRVESLIQTIVRNYDLPMEFGGGVSRATFLSQLFPIVDNIDEIIELADVDYFDSRGHENGIVRDVELLIAMRGLNYYIHRRIVLNQILNGMKRINPGEMTAGDLALVCYYNGHKLNRGNAAEFIKRYGANCKPESLYNLWTRCHNESHRVGVGKATKSNFENRIDKLESLIPYVEKIHQPRVERDIATVKYHLGLNF